jgi:predicted metallopeptidase
MEFKFAPDIKSRLRIILQGPALKSVRLAQIHCFRSWGSTSRARARIWGFPRIWQMALKQPPHYCIEVLAEKFDHLSETDKTKVLIHELLHIPKNFSGSLLPHGHKRPHLVNNKTVERIWHALSNSW